jgi:hypothetical protein
MVEWRTAYTGQGTWLRQVAVGLRSFFGIEPQRDEAAEVSKAVVFDSKAYPRAFDRYLQRVILPGEQGLTEFQRLKSNAAMFSMLLAETRLEIAEEDAARERKAVAEFEAEKLSEARCKQFEADYQQFLARKDMPP